MVSCSIVALELEQEFCTNSVIAVYEELMKSIPFPGSFSLLALAIRFYKIPSKYGVKQLLGSSFYGAHDIANF